MMKTAMEDKITITMLGATAAALRRIEHEYRTLKAAAMGCLRDVEIPKTRPHAVPVDTDALTRLAEVLRAHPVPLESEADDKDDDDFWNRVNPVRYICPCCGTDNGAATRASAQPGIAMAERYFTEHRITDYIDEAAEAEGQFEIVFLPSADNDGNSEKTISGIRYVCKRAWLFSCPLCCAEMALDVVVWERDHD